MGDYVPTIYTDGDIVIAADGIAARRAKDAPTPPGHRPASAFPPKGPPDRRVQSGRKANRVRQARKVRPARVARGRPEPTTRRTKPAARTKNRESVRERADQSVQSAMR